MRTRPVPRIFVDTNILKFSAIKHHVYAPENANFNWGGEDHNGIVYRPWTSNSLNKITSDKLKRDAIALGMLAFAGKTELLRFYIHREVKIESWGLPRIPSASGQFFGCSLREVDDPMEPSERILFGQTKTPDKYAQDYLASIDDACFQELLKMTGGFQGRDRPLNLNQARDAFYIWCAEFAEMDYFLTMDYSFQKVLDRSKRKARVRVASPTALLNEVVPKFGPLRALPFLWQGYRFARSNVVFEEAEGWN